MATRVEINFAIADKVAMDAAERGIRAVVLDGEAILKANILSRPGTGRIYTRSKSVEHQASAPGEPPAADTATLKKRIEVEVIRGTNEVRGIISANTEYAAALELGTEKMRPRPYLSRLVNEYGARLRSTFAKFAGG